MSKLQTIRDFIKDKRKDIKEERKVMYDKLQAGEYDKPSFYWNRFYETRGELNMLKNIDSFVNFQLNLERYSPYVDDGLDFIPNDDEHIPPMDIDNWNRQ
jgi:hypothetical protein